MRRAPVVPVVAPWIGAGFDGVKGKTAGVIRQGAPAPCEIRIERGKMPILLVTVSAAGVCLPDLHQRVRNGSCVFVEHPSVHDDALADRIAVLGEIPQQVAVGVRHIGVPEGRTRQFARRLVEREKRQAR